jgi:two-component system, cell cycle sensor histidine kinase and response regulator CckA
MLSCTIGNSQHNRSTPLEAKFCFTLAERSISLLSVSDSVVALLGYKAEDFLSKRISLKELIHPHDNNIADAIFTNSLVDTSDNFNIRIRQANHRIRCITGHYKQRKNQLELFLRCAKSLSQITNDQTMMANFKAMMENTDDYIYFKDCNHVFTGASQTLVAITSPIDHWEELLGLTDYDVFPEELADVYYSLEKQVFEGQSVAHEIQETLTKDGQKGWVDNRKYPIKDDTGQVIGLFGIARDITERKQAEAALIASEERLDLAMAVKNEGIWDWNLSTNDSIFDDRYYTMAGYSHGEFPQDFTNWAAHVHPDDLATADAALKAYLAGQSEVFDIEFRFKCKDGSWMWIQGRGKIVERDKNGYPLRLIGTHTDITERKRAEEQLRKGEERFLLAMRASNDGLFDWNLETNEIYYSPAWKNMLGYEDHELPNDFSVWENTIDPEDAKKSWALHQKLITKQIDRFVIEFKMKHKDGHWVDILSRAEAIFNDSGKAVRMIGTHTDITERKRAEEALLESEKQISSIFRSAPVGIGSVVNRVLSKVNSRLCEMTGYDEAELIGQSARMLYPCDEEFEFVGREKYVQIAEHGTGTVETRWQKRDGTIINVLLSSTPVDMQNQIKGVTFTALDITERKQAENNLRIAHERMLTILDGMDSSVYVADMDTYEILFMNQKMITDFGGNKTGDLCYSAFRKNSKPCDCCTNDQLVDKDGNSAGACVWHDNNPGSGKSFINHDRAIQWNDGRLVRMQSATDITDLKRMEAQLQQAQKMESVGRLAGGVAHDFNNMLGVILGHAELALLKIGPDEPLQGNLQEIKKAAERSAALTSQLLAFARKQTVAPKVVDLNETVESALKMLRRLIGENIDLAWLPGRNLEPIFIDSSQVDQILTNLCINARDAIVGTGKVTIETDNVVLDEEYCARHAGFLPGEYVMLAVSDNGCGMDTETISHIFEPFFTTKEMGKGTGLGLAMVYGAVKQNKGFINVYSELGHGTTLKIYLPRHTAKVVSRPEPGQVRAPTAGGEAILLVEDEPAILKMTTQMLQEMGYVVVTAGTPGEAIRLAREYQGEIDLLITDVVMPEMNGRDLARNIISIYPGLKRLFMSGYTANVIAHHGVLDEGVHFIQKPFSMSDLRRKLREALKG